MQSAGKLAGNYARFYVHGAQLTGVSTGRGLNIVLVSGTTFEVVEHARTWWRSLVYTSNASRSLGAPPPVSPGAVRADAFDEDCAPAEDCPLERGHAAAAGRTKRDPPAGNRL